MGDVKFGAVVGGALMVLGSFLPWARAGFFSMAGTEGDGVFTLVFGVVVLAIAFLKRVGPVPGLIVVLLGAAGVWIVTQVYGNLQPVSIFDTDVATVGTGIYVAGFGSFIAAVAGIDIWRSKPAVAPTPPAPAT